MIKGELNSLNNVNLSFMIPITLVYTLPYVCGYMAELHPLKLLLKNYIEHEARNNDTNSYYSKKDPY